LWTGLCGAGLIFDEEFRQEVGVVGDKLIQADRHAKNLKAQIASIQSKIDVERKGAANEKTEFDRLSSEIQNLQSELSKLTQG
jgi:peptidoglycan hydrolase CwlO-like protein